MKQMLHLKMGRGEIMTLSLMIILVFSIWNSRTTGNDGSGEISLQLIYKDYMFQSLIYIGEAKKPFHLVVGTSFSGFWLFSKQTCRNVEKKEAKGSAGRTMCEKAQLYDDTKITDIEKKPKFETNHIQGTVKGYVIKDKIKIDGHVLENQDVGIATEWDQSIAESNYQGAYDGYFGIRFHLTDTKQFVGSPFFRSLYDSNIITKKLYGIHLDIPRGEGEILLGGINKNVIPEGNALQVISVENLDNNHGWSIIIKSIKIGTKEVASNVKAIVDVSTNHFAGRQELIEKINLEIGAKKTGGVFLFDSCQDVHSIPTITFEINNVKFPLEGSYYHWKEGARFIGERCGSYFVAQNIQHYDLILGSPFLNKYYSVFDVEEKTISFADLKAL